jgi:heat shock protein HspQ
VHRRRDLAATKGATHIPLMNEIRHAKFAIGQVVRHRLYPFRGLIFDIDPEFANTEEWWLSIPEDLRPIKDQPFYHLYAENSDTTYVAYVSEQNLLLDETSTPLRHPDIAERFIAEGAGVYRLRPGSAN